MTGRYGRYSNAAQAKIIIIGIQYFIGEMDYDFVSCELYIYFESMGIGSFENI